MKKWRYTAVAAVLIFSLAGCGTNPELREATGATYLQSRSIESWLGAVNIECAAITDSTSPLIEGMDTEYKAYDVTGTDENTYLLLIRATDNDFTAVLNSDGELLHGMLDSGVLPAYFAENE